MKTRWLEPILVLFCCVLFGAAMDFLFNGVFVRGLFHREFTESWVYIYIPFDFAVAMLLSNWLLHSRWHAIAAFGIIAFVAGLGLAHILLIGRHESRVYPMRLVSTFPVLLRSREWPQILFLTGDGISGNGFPHEVEEVVPVTVSYTYDYGCIRSAVIRSVGQVEVESSAGVNWTWRLNKYASTPERAGPGMEDLRFPWCPHIKILKDLDEGPIASRFWDDRLREDTLKDPK